MRIKRSEFDRMLEEELAALPPEFARWIEEVPIIVEDEPWEDLLEDVGVDAEGDLLGSYHGVALTRRSVQDSGIVPDHIYLFRRPLVRMCRDHDHLRSEIRKTLLHELGHYAGMDEEDLRELGYD